MSTISSSKSAISNARSDRHSEAGDASTEEANPFSAPPDEKIFSFKEEEKERKLEEREKNKSLKIWEKNRPTREGCLRRICETDIEPSALAINPKVQNKINVGEAAGFTIPIERPKNKENRYKLIDKKREMFLVQQMLETKQREIQRLEDHAHMREDGLKASEDMLAADTQGFIDFFNKIKEDTQKATKDYEEAKGKKGKMAGELRKIIEEQNSFISRINKSLELLRIYHDYKLFLDSLAPKEWQDKLEARKKRVRDKIERRDKANQHKKVRHDDNDVQIPKDLREVIEDSDDEYELYFETPDQLLDIFASLEEKNLFLIQQSQEAEAGLEVKKHEFAKLEQEMSGEIRVLQSSLAEVDERKARTQKDSKVMSGAAGEQEETKTLDAATQAKIETLIKDLYGLCMADRGDAKMGNASTLQLLNEIEKNVDRYLQDFRVSEEIDQGTVLEEQTKIKKEQRKENRAKVQEKERIANEEKQRKRQEEKERKNFVRVGKTSMSRSSKPFVKRVKEVKKPLTEEEMDRLMYLEMQ